jgi:starch synthase
MRIVHLCSELAPIVKVGGLADVVFSLSKEIASRGEKVEILLPKYDCLDYSALKNLRIEMRDLISYEGFQKINNTVWAAELDKLKILLLETHHPALYFSRGRVYGAQDDIDRFVYFSRAAMEYLFKSNDHPHIIHLHDWPTALAAVLQKDMYSLLGMKNVRVILTIHNIFHQGRCSLSHLDQAGLLGKSYLSLEKMQDPLVPTLINLLKGGMVYSDAVVAVSPTYRQEIMTETEGCGLHEEAKKISGKLWGILNGIDYDTWNPATDPHLIKHFSADQCDSDEQMQRITEAKHENRRFLQMHLALKASETPLVACISRLVPQKAPELIKACLFRTLEKGGQFVVLGSHAPKELEEEFLKLRQDLHGNPNVAIWLDQDEALAHLLFASSDILVVPSIFEPCGLTQMIALRYGSVPVVRETGGLADTVFDIDTASVEEQKRNGFTFKYPDANGVKWALDRAISCMTSDPKRWQDIQRRGLKTDFSWKNSALKYLEVYQGHAPSKGPS